MLNRHEESMNRYLSRFGTNFRLANSKKNYVGKLPQSTYSIQLDKSGIDVSSKSSSEKPNFGTTMSSGDKNTLALAFFLTLLDNDQDLEKKVVVFDDPFTSLDEFRREHTAQCIRRIGEKAAQVIVLSHDKHFLHAIYEKTQRSICCTLQISQTMSMSAICEWPIEKEVKEGYLQDHMTLVEFAQNSSGAVDAKEAKKLVRPLLEKYFHYRFPNSYGDKIWLGDMLAMIRNDPNHPLYDQYIELDDINNYTSPAHHDPNDTNDPDAVRAYVRRTLAIVGGC